MTMPHERSSPTRLGEVLERLGSLIVDDEGAAERDRIVAEAQALERRTARSERLEAARVSLREDVRRAIVRGEPLWHPSKSLSAVQRWMSKREVPPWLFLRGTRGCGKSVAAAWAVANGSSFCRWFHVQRLARTFAAGFGPLADEQEAAIQCHLLVIDDLGTEDARLKLELGLLRLLEERKNASRRTIVTCNMTMPELERRYSDPRIVSRLRAHAVMVADPGPDLRELGNQALRGVTK